MCVCYTWVASSHLNSAGQSRMCREKAGCVTMAYWQIQYAWTACIHRYPQASTRQPARQTADAKFC
jgi:hypothetical protein